ncbi:MAG: valine--tRNA ligase [Anaerolineae bacterium]|nr:valine--tRNA ligase [Anaerolineae bacterium]
MSETNASLPKNYDPTEVEDRLYAWWEAQGYFRPPDDPGKIPFVISMPPPNVTGQLHLGHAITATLEDIMIRYHRMIGDAALWVPGADHAGIATQNVVERELAKDGISRTDLGREAFVARVWEWKAFYLDRINNQHRRLGVSCDWSRERFTLDEGLSHAVRTAFVRLYEKGLIYRGTYLVNWCPRCGTAISDLEVEHEEEPSHLWYLRYPVIDATWTGPRAPWPDPAWCEGAQAFITVATTRPETLLGDTGVAVHPDDERFQDLVGKQVVLPGVERAIPVVADEVVDRDFGTGAVKVTPAHDPTDYEIGARHDLGQVDVMTDTGTMNENAGPYAGQDRFACRENIVADLQRTGTLVRIEPYVHSIGHCQRCATIIEPRISTQWFVKIKPLAQPAIEAVRDERIRIVPERFVKIYYNWMENIRDWCISRQLWWGHRIPVWYCQECGAEIAAMEDPTECPHCGGALQQDPDVLDTWFSSGLWPFSTLGWPEETPDLARFYPTSVLETGYDILFFWVARMIMSGLEFTGQVPFHTVYLHGLVRNERGEKISKSLPDAASYDPINVIEQYGCDALRFALVTSSTPGNDSKLAPSRIEAARNFANKIWNATRFVLSHLDRAGVEALGLPDADAGAPMDRWIMSRCSRLIDEATRLIDAYQFGEAARQIQEFLWNEFCDWYIEMSKVRLYGDDEDDVRTALRVLVYVLDRSLRLLHPFMPFVTEALWQALPHDGPALIVADWPTDVYRDDQAEEQLQSLMEVVRAIRNARAEYNVQAGRRIPALLVTGALNAFYEQHQDALCTLAHLDPEALQLWPTLDDKPAQALTIVQGGIEVYLPLGGLVDLDAERSRIAHEMDELTEHTKAVEARLRNESFCTKAPAHVVQRERDKLEELRERRARLGERLDELNAL